MSPRPNRDPVLTEPTEMPGLEQWLAAHEQRKMEVSRNLPVWPLALLVPALSIQRFLLSSPSESLWAPWPPSWRTPQPCFPGVSKMFRAQWPQLPAQASQSQPRGSTCIHPSTSGKTPAEEPSSTEDTGIFYTTMSHHYTLTRMAKTKKMGNSKCQRG